jgi:hypothetical protein
MICPQCGKDSPNASHCTNCGYPIEDTPKRYLDSLYAELKNALDIQEGYRVKPKGELDASSMIQQWGKKAMTIQKEIQLSRDSPEEFAEKANIWYRRNKFPIH